MALRNLFGSKKKTAAAVGVRATQGPDAATEKRASIGDMVKSSDPLLVKFFGMGVDGVSEVVTIQTALQVPAVWCAVNFLSRTMAALPIKAYAKTDDGREAITGDAVSMVLNEAANDETNAFKFRHGFWLDYFTAGRGLAFVDKNGRGDVANLWALEPDKTTVTRRSGKTGYVYQDGTAPVRTYPAADVIDLTFMPKPDRLGSYSPIYQHAATIGLMLAVTKYGARFFKNGGVPPFAIVGPMKTPGGLARAGDDLSQAVVDASDKGSNAIAIPEGHTIVPLGFDPDKMQMTDVQRFLIEQTARIYSLPPAFLQDLTHGTFSNVEQQDLTLSKHVVAPHAVAFDQEANLKIYGRKVRDTYLETSLAGLLRGDFATRAAANSAKLNTGQVTINEVRTQDNLPPVDGGNAALIQGAMIPVGMAGQNLKAAAKAKNQPKTGGK